jgi:ribose transport system permease protein
MTSAIDSRDDAVDAAAGRPPRFSPAGTAAKLARELVRRQEFSLIMVILVLGAAATSRNSVFLSVGNLVELARATVIYFVMACAATLVLIGGGLDFSIGSIFTLGGLTVAFAMVHGAPWPLAVIAGLLAGAVCGLVNALIIERLGVPPIITTLGTFYFISGLVVVFSGGNDILIPLGTFQNLGQNSVAGIPDIALYAIVIGIGYWIVLERTRFGYNVRALGGNRVAAIANGIRARRIDRWLYVGSAVTAALAGIIYTARTGSGQVDAGGSAVTLEVASAVLIGGTSLFGGLGTITGTLFGAILFAEIDNGLSIANVPSLYENMIVGAILISAVAADYFRRQRLFKSGARNPFTRQ